MEFRDSQGNLIRTKSTPVLTTPQVEEGGKVMNYTRGEWKAKLTIDLVGWQVYANTTDIALVRSPVNTDTEIEEVDANAHLIAAAPEMFEALKAAQEGTGDWRGVVDLAIEKAESKNVS